MPRDKYHKLARALRERGFLSPILVRPRGDQFEIIDGEHRHRLARELGLKKTPCLVADLDDREARIKTLQLNGLRGDNHPERLGRLLFDLRAECDAKTLERSLPFSALEIDQITELAINDAESAVAPELQNLSRRPPLFEVFAVVVSAEQRERIERAVARAREEPGRPEPGEALARICESWSGTP